MWNVGEGGGSGGGWISEGGGVKKFWINKWEDWKNIENLIDGVERYIECNEAKVFWEVITGADPKRTCEFSKFLILDWLKQS